MLSVLIALKVFFSQQQLTDELMLVIFGVVYDALNGDRVSLKANRLCAYLLMLQSLNTITKVSMV